MPRPFLVMATQNPIESEGTYPLPEAQVDRFLMKVLVDYPSVGEEAAVVGRARSRTSPTCASGCRSRTSSASRGRRRRCSSTARSSATRSRSRTPPATRPAHGLAEIESFIDYGASPRGPIGLVQAARALALLRGRGHVAIADVRDLAADVLRHRLVLSYDALSEGVTADELIERVLGTVGEPSADRLRRRAAA